ncbi:MAG: NAD(P)/FAD-dependent oxidoreductase [Syntrophales bacterium]
MKYVIIGNGVAAIGAIEGIRKVDQDHPVTVVSAEHYKTYGRPLISQLLSGKIRQRDMYYRPESYYDENKIKLLLEKSVVKINPGRKNILLEDGAKIPFDRLLIATGGIPFVPEIKGGKGPDIYSFTTLDDAGRLDSLVGRVKEMVVLGGGLIGLKVAESLRDRGVRVTIVELADRILSAAFDGAAGGIIARRLSEVGIEIILNDSIREIVRKKGRVTGVILTSGQKRRCEGVVIAIGVVPNKTIIEGTRIKANRGILTDGHMETSIPGIYAAGDVTEPVDMVLGERRVTPIWPNAYLQGYYAGLNMAGAERIYSGGFSMNSIEFYGIPTVSMGLANPPGDGYEVIYRLAPEKNIYRKIVLRDGILVGAVLVGRIDRAGILTGFIRSRIRVHDFKEELLREDFGFVHVPAAVRKQVLSANP